MKLKIGFHVSIAKSIALSIDNAMNLNCTAFQIFSRNPRGWRCKSLSEDDIMTFRSNLLESKISPECVAVHMPYLPNLAAPAGETYDKSVQVLIEEVNRCSKLQIPYLVVHLGSHLGQGNEKGKEQLIKSINKAFENKVKNFPTILLENSAGQKNSIGSKFKEIAAIIDNINSKNIGVCLDTCHAFAAGYDLRTSDAVRETLKEFENFIGIKKLKMVHLNDSKGILGSRLDRHEHIGMGNVGEEGIFNLISDKNIINLPIIMETPIDQTRGDRENLDAVMRILQFCKNDIR